MRSLTVFWDVDTQADFIYPNGKLYVPGAETIVPKLKRLTDWAANSGVLVIASACAHHPDDPEFAQYPPHCLVGTPGQRKISETCLPKSLVIPNRPVQLPQQFADYQQIVLEKQELDVFSNPNTEAVLARVSSVREIVVYGVVSEICVAYAGRGLSRRGYQVRVVTDAIRHVDESKAQAFLDEICGSGGKLVNTEDLIAELERQSAA